MPGQALAQDDLPRVIHPPRVKHVLCNIDPEDVHLLLHWTRLLWLNGFTDLELIVAHCSRSAQGRVHFITTLRWRNKNCTFCTECLFLQRTQVCRFPSVR